MDYFTGKTVYITGGSSGIGLATARELSGRGAHMVLIARDAAKLDMALRELKARTGSPGQKIATVSADVADTARIAEIMEKAARDHGIPDILINGAGAGHFGTFEETDPATVRRIFDVNVIGLQCVSRALIPLMKKKGGGIIVNVSSLAGLIGMYGYSAYGGSKYAVVGMSEAMRAELRESNIRVQLLCPPEIDTPMVREERKSITPEGLALKKMAGQLTADVAARALLRGIRRGSFIIIPGFMARTTYRLSRHFPRFSRMVSDLVVKMNRGKTKAA